MKEFLMKKMLERQLKDIPKEMQDKIVKVASENPELISKIMGEVEVEVKNGKDYMSAAKDVAVKYKDQLSSLIS
ncbi:MAG: hypothetical protein LiPW30_519 [Parcubacteria group bacterium LiPW_30]|nr:MAG: hypothetical protein LiPW30_519 [Parcubacteria group bacterium LiPW_30]